jgi:hypothetical protein
MLRAILILLIASAAAGGIWWACRHMPAHWWRKDIVAEIGSEHVTVADVEAALRSHVWRRGQAWERLSPDARHDARAQVVSDLIHETLIRYLRRHTGLTKDVESDTAQEFDGWRRQFQPDGEITLRLGWQAMTESEIEHHIHEALADQAWLESQLQSLLKPVSETEARQWFTAHVDELRISPRFHAAQIYLTAHDPSKPDRTAEIEALAGKLAAGSATFAQIAGQYSEDDRTKSRGGDLGWFGPQRMPADFIAVVTKMSVGQTSPPFKTALGWHIVRLDEMRPSRLPVFEEVRGEIEALLNSLHRENALHRFLVSLEESHSRSVWRCTDQVLDQINPAPLNNP